jgi:uncharacterized protein (TIGR02444 family)
MTDVAQPRRLPGLWTFSKAIYAQDGVKDACLELQGAGLDVNLALFVVWVIVTGRDPAPVLGEALARSAYWRASVVQPLRDARDRLKSAPSFVDGAAAAALRKSVLKAELGAERLQQDALDPLAGLCPRREGRGRRVLAIAHLDEVGRRMGAGHTAAAAIRAFVETVFSRLETV